MEVLRQNVQTGHQGDLRKIRHAKSNQVRYMTSGSKIKESNFCLILIPLLGPQSLAMEYCNNFFDLPFSVRLLLWKLEKSSFYLSLATVAKKENPSSRSWILYMGTATEKLKNNVTTSKMDTLIKSSIKLKHTFPHFMTTFINFAYKIKTSSAKRVVKLILGIRN